MNKRTTFVKNCQPLSSNQLRAIPFLAGAKTITQGCRLAGISRETFYNWLEDPLFKEEFSKKGGELLGLLWEDVRRFIVKALEGRPLSFREAVFALETFGRADKAKSMEKKILEIEERIGEMEMFKVECQFNCPRKKDTPESVTTPQPREQEQAIIPKEGNTTASPVGRKATPYFEEEEYDGRYC